MTNNNNNVLVQENHIVLPIEEELDIVMNIDNDDSQLIKAIQLDNSSLFDVHRWSEYPEVKRGVDELYHQLKSVEGFALNSSIRKKHLRVVVLDLYVKWLTDPEMYSSYYRADWYYRDLDNRYNKLFITRVIKTVIDALQQLGFVESVTGHYGRLGGSSHIARMRATTKLIDFIHQSKITSEMIEIAPDTESIIMREWDEKKSKQIDTTYSDDDYPEIRRWRAELAAYNNLLRATYIDIPSFPPGGLVTKQQKVNKNKSLDTHKIHISQHEKFVRRVFSNNDWEQGGRFYGGWWQRIPSEYRKLIKIWDMPVSEIDYKGLHIVILYLIQGIEYRDDPYVLDGYERSERMRNLLKQVLLSSINARDKGSAIKAIRKEINFNPEEYYWVKEQDLNLSELIDAFVTKHEPIRGDFFSNRGVRLQFLDSKIAELVIHHFTQQSIPILCVHDSFLISADRAEQLQHVMQEAFLTVARELQLPMNDNPRTSITGLEVGQWQVILTDPHWREVRDELFRDQYRYSQWHKKLQEFQTREFVNYYK